MNPTPSKYTQGKYALCPACGSRPCAPSCPQPIDYGRRSPAQIATAIPAPELPATPLSGQAATPAELPANVLPVRPYYRPKSGQAVPWELVDEWPALGIGPFAIGVAVYLCRETFGRELWSGALFGTPSLAAALGTTRGAILNALRQLEQAGRIECIPRPGRKTRIRVVLLEEDRERQPAQMAR